MDIDANRCREAVVAMGHSGQPTKAQVKAFAEHLLCIGGPVYEFVTDDNFVPIADHLPARLHPNTHTITRRGLCRGDKADAAGTS